MPVTRPTSHWRTFLALLLTLAALLLLVHPVAPPPIGEQAAPPKPDLPALPVKAGALSAEWHPTGGPYEQVIFALAPGSAPQRLYAGTWGEGLYHSEDGGQTWRATSTPGKRQGNDPTRAKVRAVAVTPDGAAIYASWWGIGLFRSTDGGLTWESISDPDNGIPGWDVMAVLDPDDPANFPLDFRNVDAILIDSRDPDTLYRGSWDGFYRSEDRGDRWTYTDVDPVVAWKDKPLYALAQVQDGTLYAGTFGAGVYRSDDGGDTWLALGPEVPSLARQVYSLVIRDGVLWAGTKAGVYRTADGGQTWTQIIAGFPDDERARTVQALAFDRAGALYAGTIDFGIYRSQDGGDSWRPYNDGLRGYARSILSLIYDARLPALYAATYGAGVYRDTGAGWVPINGSAQAGLPTPAFDVQSLAFAGPDAETLVAGTLVGGLYASTDRGQSWQRWPRSLTVGPARNVPDIAVLDGGQTLVLAGGTGLRRSVDGGETWSPVKIDAPGEHQVLSLVQGAHDPALLFAALDLDGLAGVYRSTDGGAHWEQRSTPSSVEDLALSADGQTLFAAQLNGSLQASSDGGLHWQSLGIQFVRSLGWDASRYGLQVVADEQDLWQQVILGLPRRSLHLRTLDGVYSSFDGGHAWQPSLRGQFATLLADPQRPGVLYATSLTDTVPAEITISRVEVVSTPGAEDTPPGPLTDVPGGDEGTQTRTETVQISDQPQYPFWISLDDGRSWEQASASDRPLTVLARDPLDRDRLLAGTREGGVYYTNLNLPSPYTRGRALLGLIGLVIVPALLAGGLVGLYLFFLFGLRLRLWPWQVWALLFRIRAWRLVSTPRSELAALERLIAVLVAGLEEPVSAETLWGELQGLGVTPSLAHVQNALSGLQARRLLVRDAEGPYRFALVALARLAALNFDREALVDEVRSANLIARDAEAFFDQASFQVVPLLDRLALWPESPHFRALGWLNAWLHIHEPLDEAGVARLAGDPGTGSRELGFVVLDHLASPGAYRALLAARLIPLSSSEIRRAVERREAGLSLARAIREGQGQEDLFDRQGPLFDHLALFGRDETLGRWLAAIEEDRDVYFRGLPRSGRTSALWWLRTRVPSRWLKAYGDLRFRDSAWRPILRDLLSDLLANLHRTHRGLLALPDLESVVAACGPDLDLEAGLEHLVACGLPGSAPRFVFFLDGAQPGAALDRLRRLAARRPDLSLVVCWDSLAIDPAGEAGEGWLPPLTPVESDRLLETIGGRLGLGFEGGDLAVLDRAAGGHPYLLRQLASHLAGLAGRPPEASSHRVLQPGEWPPPAEPARFSPDQAVANYLENGAEAVRYLWQALPPDVQWNVRLLAEGRPLDPALEAAYRAMGLLARDEDGAPRLRIGLLARRLERRRP